MSDNLMRVQPIRNGTVLDHIKAGRGRKVLDALDLIDKGTTITLLMHVPSKKNSSKDVIKIEDRELSESESQKLALLSPGAHVNIIRNFVVAEKNVAELPESISNVAICSNDICKILFILSISFLCFHGSSSFIYLFVIKLMFITDFI